MRAPSSSQIPDQVALQSSPRPSNPSLVARGWFREDSSTRSGDYRCTAINTAQWPRARGAWRTEERKQARGPERGAETIRTIFTSSLPRWVTLCGLEWMAVSSNFIGNLFSPAQLGLFHACAKMEQVHATGRRDSGAAAARWWTTATYLTRRRCGKDDVTGSAERGGGAWVWSMSSPFMFYLCRGGPTLFRDRLTTQIPAKQSANKKLLWATETGTLLITQPSFIIWIHPPPLTLVFSHIRFFIYRILICESHETATELKEMVEL